MRLFITLLIFCSLNAEAGLGSFLKKTWQKVTKKDERQQKNDSIPKPNEESTSHDQSKPILNSEANDPLNNPSGKPIDSSTPIAGVVQDEETEIHSKPVLDGLYKVPKYSDHKDVNGLVILDSLEKLEFSDSSQFKKSTERVVAKGEVISITLKAKNNCNLEIKVSPDIFKIKPYTMIGQDTKVPSSKGLHVGTYYDALVPLDEPACPDKKEICKQSPYRWIDISIPKNLNPGSHTVTISQGNDSVHLNLVVKNFIMPEVPSMPFRVPISNWATMLAHCPKDKDGSINTCKKHFELSKMYQDFLRENRIEPYDNAIKNDVKDKEFFEEIVSDCRNSALSLPSFKGIDSISEALEVAQIKEAGMYQTAKKIKSWFYSYDEPDLKDPRQVNALKKRLALQRKHAPGVSRMVTTPYNPSIDADIFCPVVDQFDQPGYPRPEDYKKNGKEVWLYSSCMAHGNCSDDKSTAGKNESTGTPDFMIDKPAVDQMAFFIQGYKYETKGLLYYNAGEHYTRKDPWTDTFSFGGNGEGALTYPLTGPMNGKKGKFGCTGDAIAPSVRMKQFRQASQNYEWIKAAPDQELMKKEVNSIVENTKKWSRDINDYERLKSIAFP